jgi:ankyrin repeat protein
MQLYAHPSLRSDAETRIERGRQWLALQRPNNTEERTFQLLGLHWAGAPQTELAALAVELVAAQRRDGGWNSVTGRDSDAYSTAEALVALHLAGGLPVANQQWMRGLQFLLDTQKPDGSWHVTSRMVTPVQVSPPYFESGYPYGHDQFISLMGASWSIMALADALGPENPLGSAKVPEANPGDAKPWIETILFGSAADLKALLDKGFDPNSSTKRGTTALMMAAPDLEKVKLLVERGANINARANSRYSALLVAAQYPTSTPVIRYLLDHGAELRLPPGAGKPLFNATGLSLATMSGNFEAIPLFASRGDRFEENFLLMGFAPVSPTLYPATGGDLQTLRALLQAGMPVDLPGPDGTTPLEDAVIANRLDSAEWLIARGADVNHVDSYGLRPIQVAAYIDFGDSRMVELLKRSGAKTDVRDKNGMTAFDIARKHNHANLLASLQN